jgi:cell division protein FtsQ
MSPPRHRNDVVARPRRRRTWWIVLCTITVAGGVSFALLGTPTRIESIRVHGAQFVDTKTVLTAARLGVGQAYWFVQPAVVIHRLAQLPTVAHVTMTKTFPSRIDITISEHPLVALELLHRGSASQKTVATSRMQGLLATGAAVSIKSVRDTQSLPLLSGWRDEALKRIVCRILAGVPADVIRDISEIRPYASPSYPDRIKLYTRSQFEVVTRVSYAADKLMLLPAYVDALQRQGKIDGTIVLLETNYWQPPRPDLLPAEDKKTL